MIAHILFSISYVVVTVVRGRERTRSVGAGAVAAKTAMG